VAESVEFRAISSDMSSLRQSLTNESNYTSTHAYSPSCDVSPFIFTYPPSLPETEPDIVRVASNLPSSPDPRLCECMMNSLKCQVGNKLTAGADWIISNSTKPQIGFPEERKIVESICIQNMNMSYCSGVRADTINGQYGTFSACSSTERASWILNRYYEATGHAPNCNSFGGVLKIPQLSMAPPKVCRMMLRGADPLGTGAITQSPPPEDDKRSVNHSLNTLQIFGTTTGLLVFVFLIAGGLLFLQRKRKASSSSKVGTLDQTEEQKDEREFRKAELPDTPIDVVLGVAAELPGNERFELNEGPLITEIEGETGLFELATPSNEYPKLASRSSHSVNENT
jgi:hypothetical protein